MNFCSHNEADLSPDLLFEDIHYVVIRCSACGEIVGERESLIDLMDRAIAYAKERVAQEEAD